ncbi:MAG: LacI family DNA-binding transcriptional regulator [Candidatus Izemoplasmatales bacterium]
MAKVTLEKIARDMGCSKVAVYKALSDQKGVSDELRGRIKAHADALGYVRRLSPQEAKNKKFIFFISQDFFLMPSEQYYSTIFYFLSAECNKANSTLQIAFLEPVRTFERMEAAIASFKPDGIFIAGQIGDSILDRIDGLGTPVVVVDYFSPMHAGNYVFVDNFHLSYALTRYLLGKGHRRIGFVGDVTKTSSIADRYFGYLKAMREAGVAPDDDWHVNVNIEHNVDVPVMTFANLPTAFLCHCDAAAQWMYTSLAIKGLRIPDDVSIVSFDNTPLCDSLLPKLTSAGPHKDYYAKKAFTAMIEVLANPNRNVHVTIRTALVERGSVRAL